MTTGPVKVLIVDDSAVVRQVLTARLSSRPDIEVMGVAPDPIFAMEQMSRAWPDVVVLDIEMPRMDGLTFLKKIMSVRPTPVVVCSTLTHSGAATTMEALASGAVTVIAKPTSGLKKFIEDDSGDIVAAVRAAAAGNVRRLGSISRSLAGGAHRPASTDRPGVGRPGVGRPGGPGPVHPTGVAGGRGAGAGLAVADRIVAIGASTGGTQALEMVLTALPAGSPGIVLVQHMPERFTTAFAARLNPMCQVEVKEADNSDRVLPGRVLVAPGGRHLELYGDGPGYRVRVFDGPPVNRHRPSVDVLFRSVAKTAGRHAVGVIMTGMGDDGARGLLDMRQAGAFTVAQDEATCVVYGMPHEAVQLGAVDREVPLSSIAEVIRHHG